MALSREWQKWINGLGNTAIGGLVASLIDVATSPNGEFHWKLIGPLLLWNLRSYLKEHPLPPIVTETTTTTATDGTTTVVQETVKETVEPPVVIP